MATALYTTPDLRKMYFCQRKVLFITGRCQHNPLSALLAGLTRLVIRSRLGEDFLWEALQVLSQADCLSLCLPISLPCWLPSRWLTASTRPQTLRLLHLFGPVSHPQHPAQHQCVYRHTRIFFHYRKLTTRVEFPAAQNQTVLTGGTFKSNDEASIVFSKASPST